MKKIVKKTSRSKLTKGVKRASKEKDASEAALCQCGCGEALLPGKPGRLFRQGHDARFHGRVRKLTDERMSMQELAELVEPYAIPAYEDALGSSHYKKGSRNQYPV